VCVRRISLNGEGNALYQCSLVCLFATGTVQVDKVVQLYETMMTRHTTMIVGPTGGGKSVVLNTLASAQTKMGIATKLYTINPKERSVVELYGVLDPNTRNWTDGLLSNIFRDINKPTDKNERKYIVYDGDVDALWVGCLFVANSSTRHRRHRRRLVVVVLSSLSRRRLCHRCRRIVVVVNVTSSWTQTSPLVLVKTT